MTIAFPSSNHGHTRARLRRSNHARKCPICQGQGCGQADGITLCWRVQSDKQAKSGAFIHTDSTAANERIQPTRAEVMRASIDRRHQIYSALISVLSLSGRHSDHLSNVRRLSDSTIINNFASVPSRDEGDALAMEFAKYAELRGIPGFWKRYERWVMSFSGTAGFFIPIRNMAGKIEALQIRTDHGKSKYLLFSSPDLPEGCSSGAPAHYARVTRGAGSIIITEGALKAEVIAEQIQSPVVGLVAVGTFPESFGKQLRMELPKLRCVRIAFDSDWQSNEKVGAQLERLEKSLAAAGLISERVIWEGQAKGFDDYLLEVGC